MHDYEDRFRKFRVQYRSFHYTEATLELFGRYLDLSFAFDIDGVIRFKPSLRIPEPRGGWAIDPTGDLAKRLAFYIGMVELVSYWKAFCPRHIYITAGSLSEEEVAWWKKLYYFGLGEFFFRNGIEVTSNNFLNIAVEDRSEPVPHKFAVTNKKIVLVGGGKDSAVSLELLNKERDDSYALLLNAPHAAKRCALIAGFSPEQLIEIRRTIDPRLLQLNAEGALNGHTPFSALLAFVSLFTAGVTGASSIVLSNESSANEPTILGSNVNHQYSKSFEFEEDFREYVSRFAAENIEYFSLLRPFNELQIASLFAGSPKYLSSFRSCNVGSREDRWCGQCPKCLFTYVVLQPFCSEKTLTDIFGSDLLDNESLEPMMLALLGRSECKPFECVGTTQEVCAAVSLAIINEKVGVSKQRRLLEVVKSQHKELLTSHEAIMSLLKNWNACHNVPSGLVRRLRKLPLFKQ
jgi:UDP-N-acetyl-alpha-D-muramoyl-L-alanyl-L-glutamate epimerase